MNKYVIIAAVGLQALAAYGQGTAFQVFTASDAGGPGTVKVLNVDGMFGGTVTGKPFSGVEVRHSLQTLGDGTRIETKSSDKIFRDDQGRTRIEREDGTILITDPVSGTSAEITPNGHVSRRGTFAYSTSGGRGGAISIVADDVKKQKLDAELRTQTAKLGDSLATFTADVKKKVALAGEDLGYQPVNGVTAKGTRSSTTIEVGKIGNDRPINIVSERWYSQDLDMLVKSTNSDPRFGDTSYELTNILQVPPDPALFQIPAASHE